MFLRSLSSCPKSRSLMITDLGSVIYVTLFSHFEFITDRLVKIFLFFSFIMILFCTFYVKSGNQYIRTKYKSYG